MAVMCSRVFDKKIIFINNVPCLTSLSDAFPDVSFILDHALMQQQDTKVFV